MGARFQLNMSSTAIDALNTAPWKKTILHAMATYGMFFGDTGATGYFAIEAEAGNQYTSIGAFPDKWFNFGMQNWEPFAPPTPPPPAPTPPIEYVGKLKGNNMPYGPNNPYGDNIDWDTQVWSNLRVLDACVSEGTC